MEEQPEMICLEERDEDEATMELLRELSVAGTEFDKPRLQPDNHPGYDDIDDIVPAWVLALVREGSATVEISSATEEEPVVDDDSEFTSPATVEAVDVVDSGRSAQQLSMEMEEEMAAEEEDFASYISDWESSWGASGCGHFPDMSA
jgi:hypothetical protein